MDSYTKDALYWHSVADDAVQCDLCPRGCVIKPGRRGACFGRVNVEGRLKAASYEHAAGLAVDPIEKKPLNHFLPGTSVLSFGTLGCNMTCQFCQNWDLSHCRRSEAVLSRTPPETIALRATELGCASVAFTYNEPTVFIEYAMDTARACHAQGVRTVAVTNGWISAEPRRDFFAMIDAANIDLKAFTPEFYKRLCGADLDDVLDTIRFAHNETNTWLEITTLLIPGENDSPEELGRMCDWIVENVGVDVPLHFSAFHPAGNMRDTPPTPLKALQRAREIARERGIRYVYLGNVCENEAGRTRCHHCNELLIDRVGYRTELIGLDAQDRCRQCGTAWAHGGPSFAKTTEGNKDDGKG